MPGLSAAVTTAGIASAAFCLLAGTNLPQAAAIMGASIAGQTASYAMAAAVTGGCLSGMGGLAGRMVAPIAGAAAFFLAKEILETLFSNDDSLPLRPPERVGLAGGYRLGAGPLVAPTPMVSPAISLPPEPLGRLRGENLLLNRPAIAALRAEAN